MADEPITQLDAFEGHAYAVTFSPDGKQLLVGGFGGLIRVFDTRSWAEIGQYAHHEKSVNAIVFAPDSNSFAASSSDKTISLWGVGDPEPSAVLTGHRNTVLGLSWSPDGRALASGAADNTIRIWQPGAEDTKPGTLKSPYRIVAQVEFVNDGTQLVSAGGGDEVLVWDMASSEVIATLPGHGNAARSMQATTRGKTALTQADNGIVRIWSVDDWALQATHDPESKAPRSVRLSHGENRLAVMEERRVRVVTLPSLENVADFRLPIKGVHLAAFSPDDTLLAVTAADGKARVWDVSV